MARIGNGKGATWTRQITLQQQPTWKDLEAYGLESYYWLIDNLNEVALPLRTELVWLQRSVPTMDAKAVTFYFRAPYLGSSTSKT